MEAKLFFVTEPSPGEYFLNLKVEGYDFLRLKVSKEQLAGVVVNGTWMLLTRRPLK